MDGQITALAPHQQRVVEEQAQLNERIGKLNYFLGTPTYAALDSSEQYDLNDQLNAMERYSLALGRRIARWSDPA